MHTLADSIHVSGAGIVLTQVARLDNARARGRGTGQNEAFHGELHHFVSVDPPVITPAFPHMALPCENAIGPRRLESRFLERGCAIGACFR